MRLLGFLNEKRSIEKIYFAHARALYDTTIEKIASSLMMERFPHHIIVNPNVQWIQGKCDNMGFDIFFKVIDTASMIVYMPFRDGKVGNGTWRECEYAHKQGKPIFEVNPYKKTIKQVPFNKVKSLTPEEGYSRINKSCQAKFKMYEDDDVAKLVNDDGTVNGSFINVVITFTYLLFIVLGMFLPSVADQIVKLQSFMTWFFAISFGLWKGTKTLETLFDGKTLKITETDKGA